MEGDAAWIGLAGALGGVLIGAIAGMATAILNLKSQTTGRQEERSDRVREARAQLRRDAYIRFLVSAQKAGEMIDTRQPEDLKQSVDERLQAFRLKHADVFHEMDVADRHLLLVCGAEVRSAYETYSDWFTAQIVLAFTDGAPAASTAFRGWAEVEMPLIDAMRLEQERDLLGSRNHG